MDNPNSNVLFHFTGIESLKGILEKSCFKPSYSVEKIHYAYKPFYLGVPMVCFCDIPLSRSKNHMKTYGKCAIGLKKEWGMQNHISPVLYLHEDSKTKKHLNVIGKLLDNQANDVPDIHWELLNLLFYTKMYEGQPWSKEEHKFNKAKVLFYDENEWRYIVDPKIINKIAGCEHIKHYLSLDKIENQYSYENANKELKDKTDLKFNWRDISYLLVENKTNKDELIEYMKSIKIYKKEQILEHMLTCIVVYDEIIKDF